jgi:2'-5' RNA ligase
MPGTVAGPGEPEEVGGPDQLLRLFAALWPPPAVADALDAIELPPDPGLRWTPPERRHVTLAFYGAVDRSAVPSLAAALARGAGSVPGPHRAVLGSRTCRLGRNILAITASGLDPLAGAVTGATRQWAGDDRPFRGHLTLARSRRGREVTASLVDRPLFGASGVPAGRLDWEVTQAGLVESYTEGGVHGYRTLATVDVGRSVAG